MRRSASSPCSLASQAKGSTGPPPSPSSEVSKAPGLQGEWRQDPLGSHFLGVSNSTLPPTRLPLTLSKTSTGHRGCLALGPLGGGRALRLPPARPPAPHARTSPPAPLAPRRPGLTASALSWAKMAKVESRSHRQRVRRASRGTVRQPRQDQGPSCGGAEEEGLRAAGRETASAAARGPRALPARPGPHLRPPRARPATGTRRPGAHGRALHRLPRAGDAERGPRERGPRERREGGGSWPGARPPRPPACPAARPREPEALARGRARGRPGAPQPHSPGLFGAGDLGTAPSRAAASSRPGRQGVCRSNPGLAQLSLQGAGPPLETSLCALTLAPPAASRPPLAPFQ